MIPSGDQHEIRAGNHRAVVVEVGGGLRTYAVDGVPVLDGYPEAEMVTAARGQPLIPWPNRLHGGRYSWDGATYDVPMQEVDKQNALHGLCRFRSWSVVERDEATVTMGMRLQPSPPYPFRLDLAIRYSLDAQGLTVETTATNAGDVAAPYALGAHPYVTVGVTVDEAELTVPASSWLPTDDDQIPTGVEPVEGSAYDFRTARRIGELKIDYAFTDLIRDADGRARLLLRGPDRAVEVWVDEGYPYLEVFTGDTVPQEDRRRHGLGVEPMTAPPNAFVTGTDVIRLEPAASVTRSWGIRAV
ncbi:MAG: aldose 1-epimerase family protein [Mycobacteriales bacterium]